MKLHQFWVCEVWRSVPTITHSFHNCKYIHCISSFMHRVINAKQKMLFWLFLCVQNCLVFKINYSNLLFSTEVNQVNMFLLNFVHFKEKSNSDHLHWKALHVLTITCPIFYYCHELIWESRSTTLWRYLYKETFSILMINRSSIYGFRWNKLSLNIYRTLEIIC